MNRTLAVKCVPILDCSKDERKTAVENASNEMVMGAVQALYEFSPLVSQQNHSDLPLKALDNALMRCNHKKGIFREQKTSKSAKPKVDERSATECDHLREQKIHKILAAMEVIVYGSEKVSTTKHRQCQVLLNGPRQVATTCSDADCQKAIEQWAREIHQVTPARHNLFDKVFQSHERKLSQEVGTKATGPTTKFTKELALMKPAAKDQAYGVGNLTADKRLQFQIHISDAETEATTWSLAHTDRVTNQQERESYDIASNEQKWFQTEFSILLIKFECWSETIGIQALLKSIE